MCTRIPQRMAKSWKGIDLHLEEHRTSHSSRRTTSVRFRITLFFNPATIVLGICIFLVAGANAAAAFTVDTPLDTVECVPTEIIWSGGTPDYILRIVGPTTQEYTGLTGDSFVWSTNMTASSQVSLILIDSTGAAAPSTSFTIQTGTDTSCLTSDSSTGSTPSSDPSSNGSPTNTHSSTGTSNTLSSTSTHSTGSIPATGSGTDISANTSSGATGATSTSTSASTSLTSTSSPSPSSRLSTGAISGIAVGVGVLAVALIIFLGLFCYRRRRRSGYRYEQGRAIVDLDEPPRISVWGSAPSDSPDMQERPLADSMQGSQSNLISAIRPRKLAQDTPSSGSEETIGGRVVPVEPGIPVTGVDPIPSSSSPALTSPPPAARRQKNRRDPVPSGVMVLSEPETRQAAEQSSSVQDLSGNALPTSESGDGDDGRQRSNVRVEMDGGVRLAGGRPDEEWDAMSDSGTTTLPPPYFSVPSS